jgi:solute:Na+ symporter, SSS family
MSAGITAAVPLETGTGVNGVALTVLIVLFAVVTVLGFMATRFKRGDHLDSLDEWGLGGRRFGT